MIDGKIEPRHSALSPAEAPGYRPGLFQPLRQALRRSAGAAIFKTLKIPTVGVSGRGKAIVNLKVTPKIGPAVAVLGVGDEDLLIVTLSGKVIRIQTKQIRAVGRATQGVRLINLENGDKICSVAKTEES
jgi:DNA gyrase/topoisomerase IV subunit A